MTSSPAPARRPPRSSARTQSTAPHGSSRRGGRTWSQKERAHVADGVTIMQQTRQCIPWYARHADAAGQSAGHSGTGGCAWREVEVLPCTAAGKWRADLLREVSPGQEARRACRRPCWQPGRKLRRVVRRRPGRRLCGRRRRGHGCGRNAGPGCERGADRALAAAANFDAPHVIPAVQLTPVRIRVCVCSNAIPRASEHARCGG
jgi:hypothetical protein